MSNVAKDFLSQIPQFLGKPCLIDSNGRLAIFSNSQVAILARKERQKSYHHKPFRAVAEQVGKLAWIAKPKRIIVEIECGLRIVGIEYPEDGLYLDSGLYPRMIHGTRLSATEAVFSYQKLVDSVQSTGFFIVKGDKKIDLPATLPILTFSMWIQGDRLYVAGMEARNDYFGQPLLYTLSPADGKTELLDLKLAEDQILKDALALFPERDAELMLKHNAPPRLIEIDRQASPDNLKPEAWVASANLVEGRLLALGIVRNYFYDPDWEHQFLHNSSHTGIALYILQPNHTLSFLDAFSPCCLCALVEREDEILLFLQEWGEDDFFLEEIACVRLDKSAQNQRKDYVYVAGLEGKSTKVSSFNVITAPNGKLYATLDYYSSPYITSIYYLMSDDGIAWEILDGQKEWPLL